MTKDEIFQAPQHKQFEFDSDVASVFDDMLMRSIPFYKESLELGIDFILKYAQNLCSLCITDLGSSSGNFLLSLAQRLSQEDLRSASLCGFDNSQAMCDLATQKAKAYGYPIQFFCQDILKAVFAPSDVITAHYTMQFIRPLHRENLLKKIHGALKEGGIFILSEKISSSDKWLDKQMIERYYAFKSAQGYSQNEITAKREALENVLIPYTTEENIALLNNAGFKHVEILFKWVNFATFIMRK